MPPGVHDRGNKRWHAVGHHNGLKHARAPPLEVDLLGFPSEEYVCIGLELVLRYGLGHLVERVDLDVRI